MNINIRRSIALTLIIGFVILAPLLILHTAGYRYNLKKQRVTSAGSLVVKTKPRNALLTVQELGIQQQTPARVNDLPANEYTINIIKEGYFPWTKKLSIKEMETTFAEDIVLFKNINPEKYLDTEIEMSLPLSDNSGLIYLNNNAINLFKFKNQENSPIFTLASDEILNSWQLSKNDDYLWITTKNINTEKIKNTIISRYSPQNVYHLENYLELDNYFQLHWSVEQSNKLYIKNKNQILIGEINGANLIISELYKFTSTQKITDFFIFNKYLFFLENISDKFYVKRLTLNEQNEEKYSPRLELPTSSYTIINASANNIMIEDILRHETYIISHDLNSILFRQPNMVNQNLSSKDNIWVITDNSEISLVNQKSYPFEKSTINRVSQGIEQVAWTTSSNYILYNHAGVLKIIELDNREKRNIIELNTSEVDQFILEDNAVYFTSKIENGLFKLLLTD